ncbi:unnamed protein product [Fusarium equiseti]|uniref:Uncharacterized protein n=1 Tax=Fusarium equiseti TaxID=61235 RepID=A0A8J2NNP4_FUSEQ|nr:unnamed protein product [Fusarium equiseti]
MKLVPPIPSTTTPVLSSFYCLSPLRRPAQSFRHLNYKAAKKTTERNIVALQWRLSLHNEERRVFAINRLSSLEISPSSMVTDSHAFIKQAVFNKLLVGKGLWSLQKQGINVQLPLFDPFNGIPAEIYGACLEHVSEDDRKRVEQYFGSPGDSEQPPYITKYIPCTDVNPLKNDIFARTAAFTVCHGSDSMG